MRRAGISRFEYPILILLSTIGMMMVISANDLIALYLGLELLSLSSYVIAAFDRDNVRSTEAGLKYFVLGALSSGMLLYGASLVYGFTGSVSLPDHRRDACRAMRGIGADLRPRLRAAGIAFKISAVPFHMWTPDVYEGAPTPVTAFFAAAPKMAGMAMATRVFIDAFPGILGAVAADHRLHLDRLDGARLVRRHRPAQHQAPDGLFLDRQCRLRADRPRRRHAGRHPGRRRSTWRSISP